MQLRLQPWTRMRLMDSILTSRFQHPVRRNGIRSLRRPIGSGWILSIGTLLLGRQCRQRHRPQLLNVFRIGSTLCAVMGSENEGRLGIQS